MDAIVGYGTLVALVLYLSETATGTDSDYYSMHYHARDVLLLSCVINIIGKRRHHKIRDSPFAREIKNDESILRIHMSTYWICNIRYHTVSWLYIARNDCIRTLIK
jgi:hypothetical protein